MINFPRSTFTWESHGHEPDPYYKWTGGFVGEVGQAYHVRFNLQAQCKITEESTGKTAELFLGSPCRSEYTIARRNLFQIPSNEWRMAFSWTSSPSIAKRPSDEAESSSRSLLSERFVGHHIDIRTFDEIEELTDAESIVEATLNNDVLNARSTYRDAECGFTVAVEYPVNLINLNVADAEFQVCTGPVLLPDLATWDGKEVSRIFVAHVAITAFDHVEFILRRRWRRRRKSANGSIKLAVWTALNCAMRTTFRPVIRRRDPNRWCITRSGNWRAAMFYCGPSGSEEV